MLRMWRHLRLLKQGGRAHVLTGVDGTSPGELAVLCPACPYPNINLPTNWTSVTKESEYVIRLCTFSSSFLTLRRYLYYQMFGIDACFRFKRRQISSHAKDPELGPRFAYVVAWEPYNEYLLQRGNQNDVCEYLVCTRSHLTPV